MPNTAILIHGWNPILYNNNLPKNPDKNIGWFRQAELTKLLSEKFSLNYYNLPGFCGAKEPSKDCYDAEDFADEFAEWKSKNVPNPSLIITYSFGGAVALNYKVRHKDPTPIVLISPAIYRLESAKSGFAKVAKRIVPSSFLNYVKHLYQITASQYYREGTPFLRNTYDVITRRDLRPILHQVDPHEVFLIYGLEDRDTPWELVKNDVEQTGINFHLISDGGHGIGVTHPKEIMAAISCMGIR